MAIVIETVSRKGRVIHSEYFAKNTINIGRSYDNDYVIDDHYVDAYHLTVSVSEEGYTCIDNNSVNGLATIKRQSLVSPHVASDGEKILVGKTLLRIASTRTMMLPALKLSLVENVGEYLASIPAAITSLLIFLVLAINNIYLSAYIVDEEMTASVIYIIIGAMIVSVLFAFIGRLFRHDNRFLLYFSLVNCALILSYAYSAISPVVAFNVIFLSLSNRIDDIIYALLFACLLYFLFRFSTRLQAKGLFVIASIVPGLILIDTLLPDDEIKYFKFAPPYDALVRHESIYWMHKQSHDEYRTAVKSLYHVPAKSLRDDHL